MRSRIDDLHDELRRLMLEHVESIKEETFLGGLSEEEFQRHEMRLKRIRELSADYLATLQRSLRASKSPMKEGDSMPEKPSVTLPGKVEQIIPRRIQRNRRSRKLRLTGLTLSIAKSESRIHLRMKTAKKYASKKRPMMTLR